VTKIAGSGSISQRHGSADPDPDPPQNVMDPQHRQGDAEAAGAQPQDGRLHPSAGARSRRRSQVTLKGIVSRTFRIRDLEPFRPLDPDLGKVFCRSRIPNPVLTAY